MSTYFGKQHMKSAVSTLSFLILFVSVSSAEGVSNVVEVRQRITRLEAWALKIESIRAIKRLQHAYGHYAEMGLWDDLADLFAEKGIGHYPSGDLGKEAIRKLFVQEVGKGKLGLSDGQLYPHIMLQPVVTLDPGAKTAKGRWRVLAMLGSYGGVARWAGGIYENQYVLENGVWKIADLHYYSRYGGRYDQPGWTPDHQPIPIHSDPARAGDPILDNSDRQLPLGPSDLPSLSARIQDLKRRAERLHDEDEIENLQRAYGYYLDRKMWGDVADLFADNATMEVDQRGVYIGKPSIRRSLDQFGPQGLRRGELNDHLQLQIVVDVASDGRSAKARGIELIMSGVYGGGGQWGEGIFENEYIKENDTWRMKSLHYVPRLITDYDAGWGKDAQPAPGPSKDFPPDRPPSHLHGTFPKFDIVPFHFANPVTGRPTRYPAGSVDNKDSPKRVDPPTKNTAPARTNAELADRIAEVENLLKIAAAYDTTENLASAYGYYLDESMWDETADLFAIDARRRLASITSDTGRERIRRSFKVRYQGEKPKESFTCHQLIQPVIHVAPDGQSAKMRVRLFQLGNGAGGSGYWMAGIYETKTTIEEGIWKFKEMDLDYLWAADYQGGWAHLDLNSAIRKMVSAPYPEIVDPPFHYTNPVTGRKPPLLK